MSTFSDPKPIYLPNLTGAWVDVRSFADPNTPRDGTVNWQPMIQGAVNYLLAHTNAGTDVGTLYLPPGIYKIGQPIEISRLNFAETGYDPCSIQIVGDSPALATGFHASVIQADFTDLPAIIIQGGYAVVIRNLYIKGRNDWIFRDTGSPVVDSGDASIYYDDDSFIYNPPSENEVRDNRYSPYAGIHIDPFHSGVDEDDQYPYPEEMPNKYLATSAASIRITIEGCNIHGFVVGIGISLSAGLGNGEEIRIVDCSINTTKSAIAVGQTQSRAITLENFDANAAKYLINCVDYGSGTGACPSIFGANVNNIKYLFNTFSGGSAGGSINALHCETTLSLGQFGGGGSSDAHVFNACNFNFFATPEGKPAVFRVITQASVIFNGCRFIIGNDSLEPMWFVILGFTSFNSCNFQRTTTPHYPAFYTVPPSQGGYGWSDRAAFHNCEMTTTRGNSSVYDPPAPPATDPVPYADGLAPAVLANLHAVSAFTTYWNQAQLAGGLFYELNPPASSLRWIAGGFPLFPITPGDPDATVDLTVGTSMGTVKDGTATFMAPDPTILMPGDFILSRTFYDVSINATAATMALVIGRIESIEEDGTVHLVNVPEAVDSASSTESKLFIAHWPRVHLSSTGDILMGDNVITNVQGDTYWNIGNRVRALDDSTTPLDVIVPGTYIVSQDYAAHTLTLSRATVGAGDFSGRIFDADVREINTQTKV